MIGTESRWRKVGLVFRAAGNLPDGLTHAMLPTPIVLGDRIRVYFAARDAAGCALPFFVELAASDPTQVVRGPVGPLLDLGENGAFDQDGVVPTSLVQSPDEWWLYYTGFELGTRARYRLMSGIAVSRDQGESFVRLKRTPVLERTDDERLFRCAPFVWREDGRYRMYYIAGSEWTSVGGKDVPAYDLRISDSVDGVHWPETGRVSLRVTDADEHGFGRPWVMHDADRTRLYFSVRKRSLATYRLAYAEASTDGTWARDDTAAIQAGPSGWDAHGVMYSALVDVGGKRWCFYNGNDFGRDGFGAAVLEPA